MLLFFRETMDMETITQSLVERLAALNKDLEENGLLDSLYVQGEGKALLGELSKLIDLLSKDVVYGEDSYSSFNMCYLQMILGKDLNITRMVDVLCNDLSSLEGVQGLNRDVVNKLISNVKGRLRRLSLRDSSFVVLLSVLDRLGGNIPSDVLRKMEGSGTGSNIKVLSPNV